MKLNEIEQYYCKFNENKRLLSRHGQVEFNTTIHYIKKYIKKGMKVIDIGAGTGRYSMALTELGCKVVAVELVKQNLRTLQKNAPDIEAYQGNALNLKKFDDNTFDITLLLGPMYHLFTFEDKIKALNEAKRITKPNGIIFVAYYMNEYAVITHGFKNNNIIESLNSGKLDRNFHIQNSKTDLYSMERIEDINKYYKTCNLKRLKIISPDGPADYMRTSLNTMDDKTFKIFKDYVISISSRKELLGAGSHIVDILKKQHN